MKAVWAKIEHLPGVLCGIPQPENRLHAWKMVIYHDDRQLGVMYVDYRTEQIVERLSTPLELVEQRYYGEI